MQGKLRPPRVRVRERYAREAPPPKERYAREAPPPKERYAREAPPPMRGMQGKLRPPRRGTQGKLRPPRRGTQGKLRPLPNTVKVVFFKQLAYNIIRYCIFAPSFLNNFGVKKSHMKPCKCIVYQTYDSCDN